MRQRPYNHQSVLANTTVPQLRFPTQQLAGTQLNSAPAKDILCFGDSQDSKLLPDVKGELCETNVRCLYNV